MNDKEDMQVHMIRPHNYLLDNYWPGHSNYYKIRQLTCTCREAGILQCSKIRWLINNQLLQNWLLFEFHSCICIHLCKTYEKERKLSKHDCASLAPFAFCVCLPPPYPASSKILTLLQVPSSNVYIWYYQITCPRTM